MCECVTKSNMLEYSQPKLLDDCGSIVLGDSGSESEETTVTTKI